MLWFKVFFGLKIFKPKINLNHNIYATQGAKSTALFLQLFEHHLNELKLTVLVQSFLIKFSLLLYKVN